jgi:hypothetical protein
LHAGAHLNPIVLVSALMLLFPSYKRVENIGGSAGPIPGLVNRWIDSFSVFCGRARRLDSKVKESIPIPTTIPWQKKAKTKVLKKSAQSTIIHSKIVLEIPDDSFPQIRSGIESDYLLRRPEESELHKHDFSGIGPALKGGGCITANAMLLQQRREEESQSVR